MPKLYVIAGPNGIGKTTSLFDLIPINIPVINSDEIAAAVRNSGLAVSAQEYGNNEAVKMVNQFLQRRASFAMETNLADVDTWKFLMEVQKSGYELHLIYMSTDKLDLLNFRIEQRALAGEHFIRPDIVEERYINGLKLLNHYIEIPDLLYIIDNSESLVLLAEIEKGKILNIHPDLPQWFQRHLLDALNKKISREKMPKDLNTSEEVRKFYEESKQKSSVQKNTTNKRPGL